MYKFEMPAVKINGEINKQDPYPLLSEGMKKVIDYQAEHSADAFDTNCSWDELRRKYVEERRFWNEGGPKPHKVVNTEVEGPIGPIPVRLYYPDDKPGRNALVFIHGGGFTVGSNDTHDRMMRSIMDAARCVVIGVDYHLAPEAKFPIPLYESAAVVRYFHENALAYDISPENMGIGGDSGGANLALTVNLYLRDVFGGNDYIAALLLYYGAYGMLDGPSWRRNGTSLDGMRKEDMMAYMSYYFEDMEKEKENPYFAAFNHDLTYGIPPSYLCCGDLDPLLGDSELLYEILKSKGVRTELDVIPGVLHAFMHYGRMMDEAVFCLRKSGEFYASVLKEKES
ncbi:MAG: acetyl esterase [Eubacteriales bacterium]|nr:acetyl esterase [Eubacteriales bacterium]